MTNWKVLTMIAFVVGIVVALIVRRLASR